MKNQEHETETRGAHSVHPLVGHPMSHHNESENDKGCNQDGTSQGDYCYTKPNLGGGADVSTSLQSLLDAMCCPTHGEAEIECLARTDPHRQHLRALRDLWLSLGCPRSGFWRETRVFYNRILDSYATSSNDPAAGYALDRHKLDILWHTEHRAAQGYYCGGGPDMDELVAAGLMEYAGRKSFVPDPYYRITGKGREALRAAKWKA